MVTPSSLCTAEQALQAIDARLASNPSLAGTAAVTDGSVVVEVVVHDDPAAMELLFAQSPFAVEAQDVTLSPDDRLPSDRSAVRSPDGQGFVVIGLPKVFGMHVVSASASVAGDATGVVDVLLNDEGTQALAELTTERIGQPLLLTVDGVVWTTLTPQMPITNGHAQLIVPNRDTAEALAASIAVPLMPCLVTVVSEGD